MSTSFPGSSHRSSAEHWGPSKCRTTHMFCSSCIVHHHYWESCDPTQMSALNELQNLTHTLSLPSIALPLTPWLSWPMAACPVSDKSGKTLNIKYNSPPCSFLGLSPKISFSLLSHQLVLFSFL